MAINGSYRFSSNFYVIPELSTQPIRSIKQDKLKLPAGKLLADESFCNPGPIDAILGAGICFDSIGLGFQRLPNGLILQNSKFGWVVGGMLRTTMSTSPYEKSCHKATCIDDLKVSLERFWNVEELPSEVPDQTTLKNHELEDHFKRHMRIADDGRYIVRIPLRGELNQLGDSIEQAQRRLLSLERKLSRHEPTYVEYRKFMREYLELGHMAVVPAGELHKVRYVIPHSCVIKPDSTTTKLRVVFDASAKSSSGISLNDLQAIGPVIQPDLLHIWLYFRTQTVVVTADIAKMYRQVWVAEPDTWMQCILWREKTSDSAQMYRLRTVTYGEASSSYLACRALYEAGDEVRSLDPKIADAIQRSFYVDNLSLGAATADELRALSSGVERALMNRGMPLRKWASNDPTVINEVPEDHLDATVQIGDRQAIKMLGLAWCPTEDTFQLIIDDDFHLPVSSLTKRCLVARIAKLYDPVGIMHPVIVTAKILMQDLWLDNLTWDECVPHHAVDKWNEFTAQLPILRQLHIPRMALPSEAENSILHGFCDASTKAYGCAIYARYVDGNGDRQSRLVCSKSRVAPLKQLTLPRLELQAALLLAELYVRIKDVFGTRIQQTKWWTDSQVVLAWIRSDNSKWDVLVKNRVGKIQTATDVNDWRYVPTKLNPADIVSRGLPASKLVRYDTMRFWLNGPDFVVTDLCPQPNIDDVVMQATSFPNETQQMHKLGYVVSKGPLQHLNPIVRNNLICVQGRLANAEMTDGARLPILVPKSHPFSRTIIRYLHEHNFHAGTELVMAEFRTRFWMRDLRRTVIGVLSRCVVCVRARPRQYEQQMGQLPAARVNVSPAFTHTGVDLCGPFDVIPHTKSKPWITVFVCLFVCFTTKAIHLEVVENLSTSAFISALLRFVSLRGRPDAIYSDNGRNFVGAAKELSSLRKAYNNRAFQDELVGLAAEKGIRFSFIPLRSPNFGGLWEANIKVAKRLFKSTARGAQLNLIELQTLLHQISAILNSRPLTAIHASPWTIEALTPAHFLIARASFSIPATIQDDDTDGVKTRWKRVQKLAQQFWSRWRAEYLSQLRCNAKWTRRTPNVQVGQIVLVGYDNLPVGRWPLGVITKTYVGPDEMVRVADIRTNSGTYKRNVRLLAPLPIDATEKDINCTAAVEPAPTTVAGNLDDESMMQPAMGSRSRYGQAPTTPASSYVRPLSPEREEDPPPSCNIWDGRLRPKGGRNGYGT
ncbi:uncharacterized protein LOC125764469 [Anopheles funestus]|uniref:uncharacterized protein LOC125764469 n=1 Tax=Anopheles funestus TaxID=62324 RepID=UPI0020C672D5|nr:uncharacterized protein LOC125764469 [Anopheles funestus]